LLYSCAIWPMRVVGLQCQSGVIGGRGSMVSEWITAKIHVFIFRGISRSSERLAKSWLLDNCLAIPDRFSGDSRFRRGHVSRSSSYFWQLMSLQHTHIHTHTQHKSHQRRGEEWGIGGIRLHNFKLKLRMRVLHAMYRHVQGYYLRWAEVSSYTFWKTPACCLPPAG
jgi:hypothetical protein